MEIVKGYHRYINDVILGREEGPNKSVLIPLFNEFVDGEINHRIKKYIFVVGTTSLHPVRNFLVRCGQGEEPPP